MIANICMSLNTNTLENANYLTLTKFPEDLTIITITQMEKLMCMEKLSNFLNVTQRTTSRLGLDSGSLNSRSSLFIPCHPGGVSPAHSLLQKASAAADPKFHLTQCQRKVDSTLLPGYLGDLALFLFKSEYYVLDLFFL